jgi:hypothetical protein
MTKEEHPPQGWKKLDYLASGARYGGTTLCVTLPTEPRRVNRRRPRPTDWRCHAAAANRRAL